MGIEGRSDYGLFYSLLSIVCGVGWVGIEVSIAGNEVRGDRNF